MTKAASEGEVRVTREPPRERQVPLLPFIGRRPSSVWKKISPAGEPVVEVSAIVNLAVVWLTRETRKTKRSVWECILSQRGARRVWEASENSERVGANGCL